MKTKPEKSRPDGKRKDGKQSGAEKDAPNAEFIRPENEDDDGYDPYSDRRPDPEPLFERDPWA